MHVSCQDKHGLHQNKKLTAVKSSTCCATLLSFRPARSKLMAGEFASILSNPSAISLARSLCVDPSKLTKIWRGDPLCCRQSAHSKSVRDRSKQVSQSPWPKSSVRIQSASVSSPDEDRCENGVTTIEETKFVD